MAADEDFKRKKRVLKLNLARLRDQMTELTKRNLEFTIICELEATIEEYKKVKTEFENECYAFLESLDEKKEDYLAVTNSIMKELADVSKILCSNDAVVKNFRHQSAKSERRESLLGTSNSNASSSPQLEKITVPTFDGDIMNFQNFKGLFENIIHNNADLSNVQKLFYLKKAMVDRAINLIKDYSLENDSYAEAWSYLLSRFDNKRAVIKSLFQQLYTLEAIKHESQIRQLLDKVEIAIRGLRAADLTIEDSFSRFICFIVSVKLDYKTAADWNNSITSTANFPKFEELQKFLNIRAFNADDRSSPRNGKPSPPPQKPPLNNTRSFVGSKTSGPKCILCAGTHYLNQCGVFLAKTQSERFDIVKKNKLCIKCFNPFHTVANCKRSNCTTCNSNHHSLLHRDSTNSNAATSSSSPETQQNASPPNSTNNATIRNSLSAVSMKKVAFLQTAIVKVISSNSEQLGRVLLDAGSETSLVTRDFCNRANLKAERNPDPSMLIGINDNKTRLDKLAKFVIASRYSDFSIDIEAEIIGKIPYEIDHNKVRNFVHEFSDLNFADSCDLPYGGIDIILGTEYVEFVLQERRRFVEGICLRDSHFGVVVSGTQKKTSFLVSKQTFCGLTNVELNDQFKKFCNIEDIFNVNDSKNENIVEHQLIEEHFSRTFSRNETGRFVLHLPVKPSIVNLKGSFVKAKNMLIKSERRKSEVVRKAYCDFMSEYENLNHMTKLTNVNIASDAYYIPHHLVTKDSSSTTKHRVVFNASCKDESNTSLNDHLMNGPDLQPELFDNIISFRKHPIAMTADIAQMYRQILIHPDDHKYQYILWRTNSNDPIDVYSLNTLTYGTRPASFMAKRCLLQIAYEIQKDHRKTSESISSEFYMDNFMSGAATVEQALEIQRMVHDTLTSYGFPLRKYQSNSEQLLNSIDSDLIEPLTPKLLGGDSFIYVLGLVWCPKSDTLQVLLDPTTLTRQITKRVMLSEISKIFDVLGMLSPVTIKAKILMQNLWRESIDWDDCISPELSKEFIDYRENLKQLSNYNIPRCYFSFPNVSSYQLIGFCDASTQAYCAVIYLRFSNESNNVMISFICAKTRVAPLKALDIHRLELLGAVLLSELICRIQTNLKIDPRNVFTFSDSKTVLNWINFPIDQLKTFVSNRIAKILSFTLKDHWHYVDTKSNPADLATRGISAKNFLDNPLWTTGPNWLKYDFENYTNTSFEVMGEIPEQRKTFIVVQEETPIPINILKNYSSFEKCVRVMAYINRFIRNLRYSIQKPSNCISNIQKISDINAVELLSANERQNALNNIIRVVQMDSFKEEYNLLLNKQLIPKRSSLVRLNVFLDEKGLIRVKGRLSNSNLSYDTKYPIIIHRKSRFAEILVQHIHIRYFHGSPSFLINHIRSRFWVVGGITPLVKKLIHNCTRCIKLGAKVVEQFMGDLPTERVSISRPFSTTGVDLSGHFQVKCINHRSTKFNKVYIAFFVCFATRAVHIELVDDLSTEAFAAAFERFSSRRGIPRTMYSDNGTNFVGFRNLIQNNNSLDWKFISPRSPHQGGLWEAAVKSGKACLRKAIGNVILSYNEFNTVLIKVECILNSRPLSYHSNNNEIEPITPGHFLIGSSLVDTPAQDELSVNLKTRYRVWRSIIDSFWSTWRCAYLHQLQVRNKWNSKFPNLKLDDVVIIKTPNVSPLQWPMGRVVETYTDKSGIVRNVSVLSKDGIFRRSVQQLVLLPVRDS